MPVIIDDNNQAQIIDLKGSAKANGKANNLYTPKFFHKNVLTGKGGQSRGLLNEKWDPKMNPNGYKLTPNPDMNLSTQYNKDIKLYNIPCYLISAGLWESVIRTMDRPALTEMTKIATKGNEEIYITAPIHAIQIQEQQISNNQLKYTIIIVSSLPMLIAYPFFQNYFVKGVMLGSLKE